jgi:hypothetical protein
MELNAFSNTIHANRLIPYLFIATTTILETLGMPNVRFNIDNATETYFQNGKDSAFCK